MPIRKLTMLVVLVAMSVPAWADLTNGSFENGLNGWTVMLATGGDASATAVEEQVILDYGETQTWAPTDGNLFALIKTDGPVSVTTLSQTFTAEAGQQLRFNLFFDTTDYLPWNDYGRVILESKTGAEELYYTDVGFTRNYGSDSLYWKTPYICLIPVTGTYTLTFQVGNGGDDGFDSYVGVDKVELATIPAPGAALLGVIGLGLIGRIRRQFL